VGLGGGGCSDEISFYRSANPMRCAKAERSMGWQGQRCLAKSLFHMPLCLMSNPGGGGRGGLTKGSLAKARTATALSAKSMEPSNLAHL